MIRVTIPKLEGVRETVQQMVDRTLPLMQQVGEQGARTTMEYLRSYTSEMRPGTVESGGAPRPAHPGGWADRTYVLMGSYVLRVISLGRAGWDFQLSIADNSPAARYAPHLEGKPRAGGGVYSVLGFVTGPDGFFEKAVLATAPQYGLEARGVAA